MKLKRVALYARVSTDSQTTENQLAELRTVAARHDWEVVAQFVDNGISGAKGREGRPQFDAMLKSATRREFDLIASWSVDRLGRSLQDLVAFMSELHNAKVDLFLHQQAIDTSTPAGKAMYQMLGVFSEFERSLVRERVLSGLARARAEGKVLGRPRVGARVEANIRRLRAKGLGKLRIAKQLGCGVGTVSRVCRGVLP